MKTIKKGKLNLNRDGQAEPASQSWLSFATIDADQLHRVVGGSGGVFEDNLEPAGRTLGAWLGRRFGPVGAAAGGWVGGKAGKYAGRFMDYVDSPAGKAIRDAAEAAPQGA